MGQTPKKDELRKHQYRTLYELLWSGNPRRYIKEIASILQVDPRTASTIMREAFEQGYVTTPQIRRRSYANIKEYVYFVNCKDPLEQYIRYSDNTNVVYHAVLIGFANLMIFSKKKMDIDGDVLIEGYRSDYYVAFAPDQSWESAVKVMQEKVENFNPGNYGPKERIKTHWDESILWDAEDEILFREFKYNLRKALTDIMRKHLISTTKIYEWFKRLPECCTVFTRYFPEGGSSYDPCLFMVETDYEDFIIDLFSELPTSSLFFKVSDKLFLSGRMLKTSWRRDDLDMSNITQLHIPLLLKDCKERGILKETADAIFRYHCSKDL